MYQFIDLFRGITKIVTLGCQKSALSSFFELKTPLMTPHTSIYSISPQNIKKLVHWYTDDEESKN